MALPAPGTAEYANLSPDDQQKARDEARGGADPNSGYFENGSFTPFTNTGGGGDSGGGSGGGYSPPAAPAPTSMPQYGPANMQAGQQAYEYNPWPDSPAWRNTLRDSGLPEAALMSGGPLRQFYDSYEKSGYYQFLIDSAMNGWAPSAQNYQNYLKNYLSNLGGDTGGQGRLNFLNQFQSQMAGGGTPDAVQAGNPGAQALFGMMGTADASELANLLLNQYTGMLSPAMVGQYLQPYFQRQTENFWDRAAPQSTNQGARGIFQNLAPFFFGS